MPDTSSTSGIIEQMPLPVYGADVPPWYARLRCI